MWRAMIAAAIGLLILGNAPQQQPKAASKNEAKAAQHPSPKEKERPGGGAQDSGCAGTNIANMSCDAATAEATIRQADLMRGSNIISLVTALVAGLAAAFAWSASKAAQETLGHERTKSAAELRPWISIDLNVTKFRATETVFQIEYEFVFANIGQTIAKHFEFATDTAFVNLSPEHIERIYAKSKVPKDKGRYALIPGEVRRFPGSHTTMKRIVPWPEKTSPKLISFVVVATAFYWSALDDSWHRTDRSFTVGDNDGGVNAGLFLLDTLEGSGLELVLVRPSMAGETT